MACRIGFSSDPSDVPKTLSVLFLFLFGFNKLKNTDAKIFAVEKTGIVSEKFDQETKKIFDESKKISSKASLILKSINQYHKNILNKYNQIDLKSDGIFRKANLFLGSISE